MATVVQASLRERKKDKTRRILIENAMKLFLKQGFEVTSINEIVDKVDVSPRSFFRYFGTKEDIVFAWLEESGDALSERLRTRPPSEEPYVAVCKALSAFLDLYDSDPRQALVKAKLVHETPALRAKNLTKRNQWQRLLTDTLLVRMGKSEANRLKAAVIVASATSAIFVAFDQWVATNGKSNLRQLAIDALKFAGEPVGIKSSR